MFTSSLMIQHVILVINAAVSLDEIPEGRKPTAHLDYATYHRNSRMGYDGFQ